MIKNVSIDVLAQLKQQLKALRPDQYNQKLPVLNGSSIGAHTRHIMEFYQCLLQGAAEGIINYDARCRNMQIQENLDYTLHLVDDICQDLENWQNKTESLQLAVQFGKDALQWIPTNFLREEIYLIEHSVHHFALIRIGIQESFSNIPVAENFGIAYSTIAFKKENQLKQAQTTI